MPWTQAPFRRTRWSRAALVGAMVFAAASSNAAPNGRAGHIVRVERSTTGMHGMPRLCQLTTVGESKGTCFGKPPVVGEVATALSQRDEPGKLVVRDVTPSKVQKCANSNAWDFTYDVHSGDFSHMQPYETFALFDIDVDPTIARVLPSDKMPSPSGKPDEQVYALLDRDGDSAGDFALVVFACDRDGSRVANSSPYGYCLEYWTLSGPSDWHRVREDVVQAC